MHIRVTHEVSRKLLTESQTGRVGGQFKRQWRLGIEIIETSGNAAHTSDMSHASRLMLKLSWLGLRLKQLPGAEAVR